MRRHFNIHNVRGFLLGAVIASAVLWPGTKARAQQQCATTGTNQTCTNSIFLSGGAFGLLDNATLRVTNTAIGTISGADAVAGFGIAANTANITNYGTIVGTGGLFGRGINVLATGNVTNFGIISGTGTNQGVGVNTSTANVTNYGVITGTGGTQGVGISGAIVANVTNFGIIGGTSGTQGVGILATRGNVTNAGTIFGSTFAIQFFGAADTLTLLPGSKIIGPINLGGGGDTVNFLGGNHNLTFTSLAGATVTGSTPFVVVGNRAVAIDPSIFSFADRALNDITGSISGMIASRFGPYADGTPGGGGMVASYAPVYKAPVSKVPWPVKAPPVAVYDPIVVWAQGFGGERRQREDLPLVAANHRFAGGAMGFDRVVAPNLRLGAFAGGAWGKLDIDRDGQKTESDYAFGGVYGRFDWLRTFLDFAVSVGRSHNDRERIINNNLVPGGLEVARASFDGRFVSPEIAYGVRIPVGHFVPAAPFAPLQNAMLVPSARLRYLAAWYDGYTETGTTAPLTVNARALQTVEGRLQLAFTNTVLLPWGHLLRTNSYAGVLGYALVGDNNVSALLLGQGLAFPVPGKDQVSGWYYGSGIDINVTRALRLFAEGEAIELSDKSRILTGRGGIKAAF